MSSKVIRQIILFLIVVGILSLVGCSQKLELAEHKSLFDNQKYYFIVNKNDERALQAMSNPTIGSYSVELRAKNDTDGQKFQIYAVEDNKYQLVSKTYGKVASFSGSATGLKLMLVDNRLDNSQAWLIEETDQEGYYKIVNAQTNNCLFSDNGFLTQKPFEGADEELWLIEEEDSSIEWQLEWEEDFKVSKLDSEVWNISTEPKRSPEEAELDMGPTKEFAKLIEAQTNVEDNVKVKGGNLVLSLLKDSDDNLTGASVNTLGKKEFTTGTKIEIWAKLPYGPGVQSSIWLEDNEGDEKKRSEVNFFELFGASKETNGAEDGIVSSTLHYLYTSRAGEDHRVDRSPKFTLPNKKAFADDFHLFTLIWDESSIRVYVDNLQYGSFSLTNGSIIRAFERPHYLAMNISAIAPYDPDASTLFPDALSNKYPQKLEVASIKYYKAVEAQGEQTEE